MATSGPSKPPTRSRKKYKFPWLSKTSSQPPVAVNAEHPDVEPESASTNQNDSEAKAHCLWDKAWEDLERKYPKSGYMSGEFALKLGVLKKNFEELRNQTTIAQDIAGIVEAKEIGVRGTDGISQSRTRKAVADSTRFVMSTKDLVMGLSRLDPHGIAPLVLGGIYTVFQVVQNDSNERRAALTLTLDISETVAVWQSVEKHQISQNLNPKCDDLYKALSKAIIQLYRRIIVLLGTMMAYFDKGRWGKFLKAIVPAHPDWTKMQAKMKSMEGNCDKIKAQIALVKDSEDRHSTILKWISSHDIRGSYQNVLERTQVGGRYSTRCQWFIDSEEFETWRTPGANSVLWLNGTIGNGKTTLMARAIREMKSSVHVEIDAMPLAIFFFRKATEDAKNLLSVETCLQSIARQLSWNHATAQVADSVEKKYFEQKSMHSDDSRWTSRECVDLLKGLVSERESYIVIDGLDECKDPHALLRELSYLRRYTTNSNETSRPLRILISGRSDFPVANYISDCIPVVVNSERSHEDEAFFIDSEIDDICLTQEGSLFCSPDKEYPKLLKKILKKHAGGLFRWIEIQIDKFAKGFIRDYHQIEDELLWLEVHTSEDELYYEYARLLQNLDRYDRNGTNRQRAMKLLRMIACSFQPLDANDLAESMTASELADDMNEISANTVRRTLVGFVVEVDLQDEKLERESDGLPFVQLAHASVLEYLMDDKSQTGGFSLAHQHFEAALLSFARIRALQIPKTALPRGLAKSALDRPSFFLVYSAGHWLHHCRMALNAIDGETIFLQQIVDFLLDGSFEIWHHWLGSLVREEITYPGDGLNVLANAMWTDTKPASLGFCIAWIDSTKLLDFPDIVARIDFQHRNTDGNSLLEFLFANSSRSTVKYTVNQAPEKVACESEDTLVIAASRAAIDVVEVLLLNGVSIDIQDPYGDTALYTAVARYHQGLDDWRFRWDPAETKALEHIIRVLVAMGADIFVRGCGGETVMHHAAKTGELSLTRLFLHRAMRLEEMGLHGSVQRLIRARDWRDGVPSDYANSRIAKLLEI